jgi:hypothetical protein
MLQGIASRLRHSHNGTDPDSDENSSTVAAGAEAGSTLKRVSLWTLCMIVLFVLGLFAWVLMSPALR